MSAGLLRVWAGRSTVSGYPAFTSAATTRQGRLTEHVLVAVVYAFALCCDVEGLLPGHRALARRFSVVVLLCVWLPIELHDLLSPLLSVGWLVSQALLTVAAMLVSVDTRQAAQRGQPQPSETQSVVATATTRPISAQLAAQAAGNRELNDVSADSAPRFAVPPPPHTHPWLEVTIDTHTPTPTRLHTQATSATRSLSTDELLQLSQQHYSDEQEEQKMHTAPSLNFLQSASSTSSPPTSPPVSLLDCSHPSFSAVARPVRRRRH